METKDFSRDSGSDRPVANEDSGFSGSRQLRGFPIRRNSLYDIEFNILERVDYKFEEQTPSDNSSCIKIEMKQKCSFYD